MKLSGLFYISSSLLFCVSSQRTLVVFGDDSVSYGNNFPSSSGVSYYNGRMSNGPLWTEYAAYFSGNNIINYAYQGAVSNNTFVGKLVKESLSVPSLYEQVRTFGQNFGGKLDKNSIANDTVVISVGTNDIKMLKGLIQNNSVKFVSYVGNVIASVIDGVSYMRSLGYTRFVISNLPQVSRMPYFSDSSVLTKVQMDLATTVINALLLTKLKVLKLSDKGFSKSYVLDNFSFQALMIPESKVLNSVGISKMGSACYNATADSLNLLTCSDPRNFYFLDSSNPTTMVNGFYGAMVSEFLNGTDFTFTTNFAKNLANKYMLSKIYSGTSDDNYLNSNMLSGVGGLTTNVADSIIRMDQIIADKSQS
ncbi:hypothetical protein AYI68_g32 [Smittium mucronatum]|uniref:GDSL esterase/lipase n=1 Tax=Smittium mucronatum TaxID=133383 RepID=A0A1R0H9L5_9FUNG|nr:hypothetical protein AYI68_g32 [Smittium mucronatum]